MFIIEGTLNFKMQNNQYVIEIHAKPWTYDDTREIKMLNLDNLSI
jgi:hypothetical protein